MGKVKALQIGLLGERSGDRDQLSADPDPTWVVTSLPQQSRAPCAKTGSQDGFLLSSYIILGFHQGDRASHALTCQVILIFACGIRFFSLSSFLSFTSSLPHPPRLRQFAAAHRSGISEHLIIQTPAPFFSTLASLQQVFTVRPEGSWCKTNQSRPPPCSKPSHGSLFFLAHWSCCSQNMLYLFPPKGLRTYSSSFLISLLPHFMWSPFKCHLLAEAFPDCFILRHPCSPPSIIPYPFLYLACCIPQFSMACSYILSSNIHRMN